MKPGARAALIALALALGLADGLPIPSASRAAALSPRLVPLAERATAWQGALLAPYYALSTRLMLGERWVLFAGARRERFRLEVAARSGRHHPFELLYRADDPRHRFLAGVIEYRRVRGAWNPRRSGPPAGYEAFASFVARRVFESRRAFHEVRVRMERIVIREGGRGYASTGEYEHELVRSRREVL